MGSSITAVRRATSWVARGLAYALYFWMAVNLFFLVVGFLLKLLGANPGATFTDWVYRGLDRVMAPFRGIFTPVELSGIGDVEPVVDASILFAIVVYGVVLLGMRALIDWLTYRVELLGNRLHNEAYQARLAEVQAAQRAAADTSAEAELQRSRDRAVDLARRLEIERNRADELATVIRRREGG